VQEVLRGLEEFFVSLADDGYGFVVGWQAKPLPRQENWTQINDDREEENEVEGIIMHQHYREQPILQYIQIGEHLAA